MPTYEYFCTKCHKISESFQKITDTPLSFCSICQEDTLTRKPGGGIGLAFKGTGFYHTDYAVHSSKTECCPCGKNTGGCENS